MKKPKHYLKTQFRQGENLSEFELKQNTTFTSVSVFNYAYGAYSEQPEGTIEVSAAVVKKIAAAEAAAGCTQGSRYPVAAVRRITRGLNVPNCGL